MQVRWTVMLLMALFASSAPEADASAESSACPRPGPRVRPEESGPIGSMQRDELLADRLANPEEGTCRESHTPLISELTRHVARLSDDIWWNDSSGLSLGVVHRTRWQQLVRDHFIYYDEEGQRRAEGTQPLWSAGLLYTTLSELYITDAQGELLLSMHGTFWTLNKVYFHLRDKDGRRIADAHVDGNKSSIVFSLPGAPLMRIASLLREQATDDSFHRWRMIVLREDLLPDDAWPLLAAFFARFQDPSGLAGLGAMLRNGLGSL